jgi:hypothetical protein
MLGWLGEGLNLYVREGHLSVGKLRRDGDTFIPCARHSGLVGRIAVLGSQISFSHLQTSSARKISVICGHYEQRRVNRPASVSTLRIRTLENENAHFEHSNGIIQT